MVARLAMDMRGGGGTLHLLAQARPSLHAVVWLLEMSGWLPKASCFASEGLPGPFCVVQNKQIKMHSSSFLKSHAQKDLNGNKKEKIELACPSASKPDTIVVKRWPHQILLRATPLPLEKYTHTCNFLIFFFCLFYGHCGFVVRSWSLCW